MPRARTPHATLLIDATRFAERLTPRELEVLTRIAAGLSNRVIATDLGIGYTTVRGDVQSVLAKLGARSRVDAVARAYRSGLVHETEGGANESAADRGIVGSVHDRKPRRGPGDKATNDIRGFSEAHLVKPHGREARGIPLVADEDELVFASGESGALVS